MNPRKLFERAFNKFNDKGWFKWVSDEVCLKILYHLYFDKKLNLKQPQTFNEKIQWLKLYDRQPEYTRMVDKFEAKKYVEERIGAQYIIPTLGVCNRFDDIDVDALPQQFVLKCTHDSGSVVVVKDKSSFNRKEAKMKLERGLKRTMYYTGREWPYKNVKPRIIAEKYMVDAQISELRDYKFFCFNGKAKCFKIDFNRFINHQANYYDVNGTLLPFGAVSTPDFDRALEMPCNLSLMVKLAEKLSVGIPFVRVDFYEVDGKVYFGEMTFFPAAGFGHFTPEEWDYKLGEWIKLPDKN